MEENIVFGPVPSRRLGQSLGINNVPHKTCSYSCVYCQVGKTAQHIASRQSFYDVEKIVSATKTALLELMQRGEKIDYISFVADGEPTIDINIGREITELKKLGRAKIAVITNSSTLWIPGVRNDLKNADLVSLKADTASEKTWHDINRPAPELDHGKILGGMRKFASGFKGTLLTETLLVKGINDSEKELEKTAGFIATIKPATAFLGIPSRPPAEQNIHPPSEATLAAAYSIFKSRGLNTEVITGPTEGDFGISGNPAKNLQDILAVHPMSRKQVEDFLEKAGTCPELIEKLVCEGKIKEVTYNKERFYIKKFT